jgi:hypothetical protein
MLLCSRRSLGFFDGAKSRRRRWFGLVLRSIAVEHPIMRFIQLLISRLFPLFSRYHKKDHKKVKDHLKDPGVRSEEYWEGVWSPQLYRQN